MTTADAQKIISGFFGIIAMPVDTDMEGATRSLAHLAFTALRALSDRSMADNALALALPPLEALSSVAIAEYLTPVDGPCLR